MKKIEKYLDYTFENKMVHILIILFVTIALSVHMKEFQVYDTHDGPFHLLRILVTSEQIDKGITPAIISPYSWNGLGVGMNLFYPPISTYVPIFFMKIFGLSAGIALKCYCILSIFLSGLFMYMCINEFTKNRKIAIISAIIYMILPYKLNNLYVRAAVGEIGANVFMPLVFMGLHNLIEGDEKKHYFIAIGAVGVLLSHTISTMYVAIFGFIYVLLHIKKIKNWSVIRRLLINCLFIVLIGGVFVFPYLETSSSAQYRINTDELMGTYNEFLNDKTLELSDLLHNVQVENHMVLYLGMPAMIGLVLTTINLPLLIKEKKIDRNYVVFLLFTVLCIWMSIKSFPWLKIPKIFAKLQFPWRMMGFGNFFMSFIVGINYYNIFEKMPRLFFTKDVVIVTLICVAVINAMELSRELETWGVFKDEEVERAWKEERWFPFSNYDFAPVKVDRQVMEGSGLAMRLYCTNNNIRVSNEVKTERLRYSATVENLKKGDIVSVPYLYYPYYELKISENSNAITKIKPTEAYNGMVQFEIDKDVAEKVDLEIYYKPSLIVILSYYGSSIALVGLIAYIAWFKCKNKKCQNKTEQN